MTLARVRDFGMAWRDRGLLGLHAVCVEAIQMKSTPWLATCLHVHGQTLVYCVATLFHSFLEVLLSYHSVITSLVRTLAYESCSTVFRDQTLILLVTA